MVFFECKGVSVVSLEVWIFSSCQKNLTFLMTTDASKYCPSLTEIINRIKESNSREMLIGFLLSRMIKSVRSSIDNTSYVTPSALVFKADDSINSFFIQSYQCAVNINTRKEKDCCKDCKLYRRKSRGFHPCDTVLMSVHKRILKKKDNTINDLKRKSDLQVEENKVVIAEKNRTINRLRKKICYWKLICKDIRSAVEKLRNIEHERKGFISITEDESQNWFNFYSFIDKFIEQEHRGDNERIKLHKELIRSEMNQLGKFNKNGDKRGIRTTKISTRIFNYSLGLAHNLKKHKYEEEATFRSLLSWCTLTW